VNTHSPVWHPCTQMKRHDAARVPKIVRGEGVWLIDATGRRYLDAISSWWVNLFGHCNPRINAAVCKQLEQLEHVLLAGVTHTPAIRLSERLSQSAPAGLGHCFYASDGASAIEIALKMSAHFWRNTGRPEKNGFVSLQNAYHGETLGALSVTDVALFKSAYATLLRPSHQVISPDWRNRGREESMRDFALRCAQTLDDFLDRNSHQIAAFIVEPLVQCAAGMAMYDAQYLRRAREICTLHQVHLIADEIAVGFGRTGKLFACEHAGISPDFLCLSKGLSGGYLPLSTVLTTDAVYGAFYDDDVSRGFLHSHSYSGNPLACSAALASLDIFEQDPVLEANIRKAAYLNAQAEKLRQHSRVKNFRNLGMIWAFDVEDADQDFSSRFSQKALERGLLLRPLGATVYFMPPYVIDHDEIDFLLGNTLELLEE
jgi:adenosylmethionine-8-amino-7-oxononanoate aminotransferase